MWWACYNQLKGFKSRPVASWRRKMMLGLWSADSACAQEVQPALPDDTPVELARTYLPTVCLLLSSPVCHLGSSVRACHTTFHGIPDSRPSNFVQCDLCDTHSVLASAISFITCCALFSIRNPMSNNPQTWWSSVTRRVVGFI